MKKIEDIVELERLANRIRQDLLETTVETGFEQPASYLSATEIVTALFFNHLRHDPARPGWAERDRLILSRGHGAPVLYCAYVEAGALPRDLLSTLCKPGSQLPHPLDSHLLPLLEASATSLGNGLSLGLGAALSGRLEQVDYRVHVLLGNDDIQGDQFWEPAMWTSFHKADHLSDIPIVVQNPANDATARLLRKVPTARLTSVPGPQGWNETILEVVKQHPVLAK